jgi:dihydropteroate synthase
VIRSARSAKIFSTESAWDTEMPVMNRKIYYWKLRESEMQLGERTLIMGVLNVTPDSFSDGGRFNDPDRAFARALELEEQGADIIDIGAESTRPGSQRISADEEWQRLVPVLKRLRGGLRVPLSLDTYKSEIAERALQYGVEIFNDPSGLTFDPGLAKVAANGNAGLILNHMRGQPDTWGKLPPMQDPLGTIARELDATVSRARHAGVDRARIVIDPGIGFGKRKEQNAEIIGHLRKLAALDYPILIGASRKSFLAQSSEQDTAFATAAAVTGAILNGAHIVRVHDVKEMQNVVLIADEIAHAAGIESRLVQSEEHARGQKSRPMEDDRPKPTRPPIAKPVVVEAMPAAPMSPPPETRTPGKFSVDREKARGGFLPPSRRPAGDRSSSGPPRRDFRSAGPRPTGPKRPFDGRPFEREAEKPRGERREFRPGGPGGRPPGTKRPSEPGGNRSEGRPPRGTRPAFDRKGPPKRPFRKRP